jgi:hypothetical protein
MQVCIPAWQRLDSAMVGSCVLLLMSHYDQVNVAMLYKVLSWPLACSRPDATGL